MIAPDTQKHAEYVVPFPYGSNVRLSHDGQPETYLTVMSTMAIDAAILTHHHSGSKIVIPGETPFEDLSNTTKLMADRALAQDVPKEALVQLHSLKDGRRLNNTYLQAEGLAEHVYAGMDIEVIALAYHIKRVQGAVKAFGIDSTFKTVESIFAQHNIHDFEKYYPVIAKLRRSELMARLITNGIGLPKGQIPNFIVKHLGARVVDVHEDKSGQLSIENDLVKRKRARLEARG